MSLSTKDWENYAKSLRPTKKEQAKYIIKQLFNDNELMDEFTILMRNKKLKKIKNHKDE